jgi:ankyrin repeat protein
MKKSIICLFIVSFLCSCSSGIHSAVKDDRIEDVKKYVAKGDINNKGEPYGHTALHVASYYGYADIVTYLCEQGADVNVQANDGTTPLIFAAQNNYPNIIQTLLNFGAKVNLKDKKGYTALYFANEYRYSEIAKRLEDAGAISE